jgi:hypothetical protein
MFHPIQSFRNTLRAVQLTVTNFQRLLFHLIAAIEKNTTALADQKKLLESIEAAQRTTAKAAQYLAAIERHRQETAGQRADFGLVQ